MSIMPEGDSTGRVGGNKSNKGSEEAAEKTGSRRKTSTGTSGGSSESQGFGGIKRKKE